MGKNEGITFLPLREQQPSSGRTIQYTKDRVNVCLTSDWAKHIYKKVEMDS